MGVTPEVLLLKRERELTAADRALTAADAARGTLLVVEGPAGIGKNRTAAGGACPGRGSGRGRPLRAGAEMEREFAFGVVRQLVEPPMAAALAAGRAALLGGRRTGRPPPRPAGRR